MTLLFAEMDPDHVQIREIPKLGRNAVDTNELFIDDLFVADEDVVGEVGKGFRPSSPASTPSGSSPRTPRRGIGRAAVRRATSYANERHVFGRPIGQNQAVAHPIAEAMMRLDAAQLVIDKAAWLLDNGYECGEGGQRGQVPRRRRRVQGRRRRHPDARRLRATARSSTSSATSARPA